MLLLLCGINGIALLIVLVLLLLSLLLLLLPVLVLLLLLLLLGVFEILRFGILFLLPFLRPILLFALFVFLLPFLRLIIFSMRVRFVVERRVVLATVCDDDTIVRCGQCRVSRSRRSRQIARGFRLACLRLLLMLMLMLMLHGRRRNDLGGGRRCREDRQWRRGRRPRR
jgi:hypothetical protein